MRSDPVVPKELRMNWRQTFYSWTNDRLVMLGLAVVIFYWVLET
jgi:hypothetical protein